jgi:prephenate dehydrogenase
VAEVVGADNDRRELRDALELEAITSRARSVEEALEGADLIVAATPVRSLAGCSRGPTPPTRTPSSPMSAVRSFTF